MDVHACDARYGEGKACDNSLISEVLARDGDYLCASVDGVRLISNTYARSVFIFRRNCSSGSEGMHLVMVVIELDVDIFVALVLRSLRAAMWILHVVPEN